ncbi:ZCHC3 protein, partial [Polypterus senegalus]
MVPEEDRKNAVRFQLMNEKKMDRKSFTTTILLGILGFLPRQVDFIFALPDRQTFEVVFTNSMLVERCLKVWKEKREMELVLVDMTMQSLAQRETKSITVAMLSEKIRIEDIQQWLGRFCKVERGMAGRDEHGIKTGYYNFQVKLRISEEGDLKHLPPTIQIGAIRGIIFYSGQPKMCRKCEQEGHVAADCKQEKCKNCGELGHLTRNCQEKIMCHLCGENTHSFKSCPLSYANKCKKVGTVNIQLRREEEEEEEVSEEEGGNSVVLFQTPIGSDEKRKGQIEGSEVPRGNQTMEEKNKKEDEEKFSSLGSREENMQNSLGNIQQELEEMTNILLSSPLIPTIDNDNTGIKDWYQLVQESNEQVDGKDSGEVTASPKATFLRKESVEAFSKITLMKEQNKKRSRTLESDRNKKRRPEEEERKKTLK